MGRGSSGSLSKSWLWAGYGFTDRTNASGAVFFCVFLTGVVVVGGLVDTCGFWVVEDVGRVCRRGSRLVGLGILWGVGLLGFVGFSGGVWLLGFGGFSGGVGVTGVVFSGGVGVGSSCNSITRDCREVSGSAFWDVVSSVSFVSSLK